MVVERLVKNLSRQQEGFIAAASLQLIIGSSSHERSPRLGDPGNLKGSRAQDAVILLKISREVTVIHSTDKKDVGGGTSIFCRMLEVNPRKRVRPQPLTVAGEGCFTKASMKAMGPMQIGRTAAEKLMGSLRNSSNIPAFSLGESASTPIRLVPAVEVHVRASQRSVVRAAVYQETLDRLILPSADELYGGTDFIFRYNLAPAYISKTIITKFNDSVLAVLCWPANLLGLNPTEHEWSIVKRNTTDTMQGKQCR
ncbi:hypothetical protein CCH79_00005657 [Gambusia affinis]|uniref:Uncharacterized protein n=1 Tax=Gambusia affinis TaxID=33528 RepID=A0A315V654_GAMAF|nr:hypothetical protein CCH79_00005657 [Gambusia affinis]